MFINCKNKKKLLSIDSDIHYIYEHNWALPVLSFAKMALKQLSKCYSIVILSLWGAIADLMKLNESYN